MATFPTFPAAPDFPEERRARGPVTLRFEDITQDGRLALEAMAPALGEVVWRKLLPGGAVTEMIRKQGIVPILTKLVVEGVGGPFSTASTIDALGMYDVAHAMNAAGEVDKILVRMWIEATLPIGRNYGPKPEHHGEPTLAGRLYAEHVLTRLFAAPGDRKVTRLEVEGVPPVPGPRVEWQPPNALLVLPEGATPLDAALTLDPTPIAFGLSHTDSNQHVNSLVYPRLFEDAALRRFAALGKSRPPVKSQFMESAFRKPCFAGETYAIALRAFTLGGKLGAIGAFVAQEDATSAEALAKAKPHCCVRAMFEA